MKHILILPDGGELSSGPGTTDALCSITLTEVVNDGEQISPGSVCAAAMEASIFTPEGALHLPTGGEVTLYREEDTGERRQLGIFILEKPERTGANTLRLTAYDRVSRLDKDLSGWLSGLKEWPYRLSQMAEMVCAACDLELIGGDLPNGDLMIRKFSGEVTGRQMLRWIGEASGRFCRATPEGKLKFFWYEPRDTVAICPADPLAGIPVYDPREEALEFCSDMIGGELAPEDTLTVTSSIVHGKDDGESHLELLLSDGVTALFYYQNALTLGDYQTQQVQKVQIRQTQEDVGTIYPQIEGEVNTYCVTENPLLTTMSAEELLPAAKVLYEILHDVQYTPCTIELPESALVQPGDILQLTDKNGARYRIYVMTKRTAGRRMTISCTGSPRLNSSDAVNNRSIRALSGKMMALRTDVEGIAAQIRQQEEAIFGEGGVDTRLTELEANAEGLSLQVKRITEDGVSRITTGKSYTFDDEGLHIADLGSESGVENRLNNNGMFVSVAGSMVLQADRNGVQAENLTARNYLTIGRFARFEDYSDGVDDKRTACYYV